VVEFADRQVTTLSSGERMRVMVARALAQTPKVLLADEPVAALDPYHQLRVMELLAGLAHGGSGVLAVMHDLSLAARFCDRLVLLVDGAIVAQGSPDQVLTPERLREAYGVDVISGKAGSHVYALPDDPESAARA
jgi:iron complex transport system ATP-binding protein